MQFLEGRYLLSFVFTLFTGYRDIKKNMFSAPPSFAVVIKSVSYNNVGFKNDKIWIRCE